MVREVTVNAQHEKQPSTESRSSDFYEVELTEKATGITRRVPYPCPWHATGTHHVWRNGMCDHNIAGYFTMGQTNSKTGEFEFVPGQSHDMYANRWMEQNGCDHSMPATRFVVGKAYFSDGRALELL
jgi:hypothetical protein